MRQAAVKGRGPIAPEDYQTFRKFLHDASGIDLGEGKEYLVSSRLGRLMRQYGFDGLGELTAELRSARRGQLRTDVIDAMTTNETFWFRDQAHFNLLTAKVFPEAPNRPFRLWSAACSSGQEPYSISMQVQDYQRSNPGRLAGGVEILASDISPAILEEARKGVYSGMAVSRGLDEEQRRRFFVTHADGLQVRPEIRRRVRFQELNLTKGFTALGRFDVIFCRNVLIYFPAAVKGDIIRRMAGIMHPGGYLFVGSTESMSAHTDIFEMVAAHGGIAYRLKS